MIELNQYDAASEQLSQALSIDNQHAQTWYMFGFVQRLLDDFSAANESFKKCIKLDPSHEQAREMLGRTLTELEDLIPHEIVLSNGYRLIPTTRSRDTC